jgi:hypothetical protein
MFLLPQRFLLFGLQIQLFGKTLSCMEKCQDVCSKKKQQKDGLQKVLYNSGHEDNHVYLFIDSELCLQLNQRLIFYNSIDS